MEKPAVIIALTLSVLVTAFGAVILVYPEALSGFIRALHAPSALYVDAGFRVVYGAALFFAAPKSRGPTVLRALGVMVLASGLLVPVIGVDGFQRVVQWKLGVFNHRVLAVGTVVSGALLTYALVPRSRAS